MGRARWRGTHPLLLALLIALSPGSELAARELTILTDADTPPYEMLENDKLTGISVDLMQIALARVKLPFVLHIYPWNRAFRMARTEADTCLFTAVRTEARENLFQWVGPLAHDQWVVYGRADDSRRIASITELRPFRVGAIQGEALAELLGANGITVDAINGVQPDMLGLRKLRSKRIDFWAANEVRGDFTLAKYGREGIIKLLRLRDVDLYLACSPSTDRVTIDLLNEALGRMKIEGVTAAIIKSYLPEP